MYPINLGTTFMLQEVVSGTGVFDGTEQGRAFITVNPLDGVDARVIVRAKRYGTLSNAYNVLFIDPGAGVNYPTTRVALNGTTIEVRLRRTTVALQATAAEVAAAINAFADFAFPVVADPDPAGTGLGVVSAAGPTALASGQDASFVDLKGQQFKWTRAPNTNGGLFYFEQEDTLIVRSMLANMVVIGSTPFKIQRVNLTSGLAALSAEKAPIFDRTLTPAAPDIGVTDVRIILLPYQALFVTCAATGLVQMDARREARFPYL
jgi:hypothetical protein